MISRNDRRAGFIGHSVKIPKALFKHYAVFGNRKIKALVAYGKGDVYGFVFKRQRKDVLSLFFDRIPGIKGFAVKLCIAFVKENLSRLGKHRTFIYTCNYGFNGCFNNIFGVNYTVSRVRRMLGAQNGHKQVFELLTVKLACRRMGKSRNTAYNGGGQTGARAYGIAFLGMAHRYIGAGCGNGNFIVVLGKVGRHSVFIHRSDRNNPIIRSGIKIFSRKRSICSVVSGGGNNYTAFGNGVINCVLLAYGIRISAQRNIYYICTVIHGVVNSLYQGGRIYHSAGGYLYGIYLCTLGNNGYNTRNCGAVSLRIRINSVFAS